MNINKSTDSMLTHRKALINKFLAKSQPERTKEILKSEDNSSKFEQHILVEVNQTISIPHLKQAFLLVLEQSSTLSSACELIIDGDVETNTDKPVKDARYRISVGVVNSLPKQRLKISFFGLALWRGTVEAFVDKILTYISLLKSGENIISCEQNCVSEKSDLSLVSNLNDLEITDIDFSEILGKKSNDNRILAIETQLPPALSDSLYRIASDLEVEETSVYLAAFIQTVSRYCEKTDLGISLDLLDLNALSNSYNLFSLIDGGVPCKVTGDTYTNVTELIYIAEKIRQKATTQYNSKQNLNVRFVSALNSSQPWKPQAQDWQILEVKTERSPFQLTVELFCTQGESCIRIEGQAGIFNQQQLLALQEQFLFVLQQMLNNLTAPLTSIEVLTQNDLALLDQWNNTHVARPTCRSLHSLIESVALQKPEAIAISDVSQQFTYRELNLRANQLAQHLRQLGVGTETLIAVCMQRSVQMLVAVVGILKAGGAYVPVDPAYPSDRITSMLADSGVSVIITENVLVSKLPESIATIVCFDTDWAGIALNPSTPVEDLTEANHLAYVIYTSGSTGKPKGVCIEHRSVIELVHWVQQTLSSEQIQGVLASTSLSFDVSVMETLVPLSLGAEVIVGESVFDVHHLAKTRNITMVCAVPSIMSEVIREVSLPDSVRVVCLAGEALSYPLARKVWQSSQIESLLNLYGPTEDTVYSTCYRVPKDIEKNPSIGTPISNTQTYILNQRMERVPIGVSGELFLGGQGLARNYLNRQKLTEERFIPNPFTLDGRLYRTGDRVRYREDGTIEYLGRLDQQVKIRGVRIELGEIEAALCQQPSVHQAVVIKHTNKTGWEQLIAYIVPLLGNVDSVNTHTVRDAVAKVLPDFMMPSQFIVIERLPLTPNGKLDRKALQIPEETESIQQKDFVAPRTTIEEILVKLWAGVLKKDRIGIYDNFFALGGHSLLATQLISRVQGALSVNLPLRTLFENPTVASLAECINASLLRQERNSFERSPLVAIQPLGSKPNFFCVHPVGGNVLCYVDLANHLGLDQPFYGLQSLGLDESQGYDITIENMAANYIQAIRVLQPRGPYFLGGWSLGGVIAFEMARQLEQQGDQVEFLALIDSWAFIPETFQPKSDIYSAELLSWFASDLGAYSGKELAISVENLQGLDLDGQLNYVLEQAKKSDIFPPDTKLVQIRHLVEVALKNLQSVHKYQPQSYSKRVTLFQVSEQLEQHLQKQIQDWNNLAGGGVTTYTIPGNHYSIMKKPHVQVLATHLKACLDETNTKEVV